MLLHDVIMTSFSVYQFKVPVNSIRETRTVLTRRVSSYGLPAALSDYGVNAAGIAEIVVIFRNDSSLAEMSGSFA